MIRSIVLYAVLLPALALWLFMRIVPDDGTRYGRARGAFGPPALTEVTDRLFATSDTVRALDDAYARVHSRVLAHRVATATVPTALERGRPSVTSVGETGVRMHADPLVTERTRGMLLSIVEQELAAIGASTPAVPIAIIAVVDSGLLFPRYRRAVVLPRAAGEPCTVIFLQSYRFLYFAGTGDSDRLLGTCAFHAAYGDPGAGMRAWLERSRMRHAAYLQAPGSHGTKRRLDALQINSLSSNAYVMGCRGAREGACDSLFDAVSAPVPMAFSQRPPVDVGPLPRDVLVAYPHTYASAASSVSHGLLAAVATHLGKERFSELWRSDAPVRESFARLEGRPLAEWVGDHVTERMPAYSSGPGLSLIHWGVWLLLCATFAAIALYRTPRALS